MEIVVAHPANKAKMEALMAFLNALQIQFEVKKNEKSPYNPEFVEMVLQGDKEIKEGKGRVVSMNELDNLWK